MRGTIRCKHPCERCGQAFVYDRRAAALLCPCGNHATRGIYIDLHHGKPVERLRLYTTKRGQTFASGREAYRTLEAINLDIDDDSFNAEDYRHKQLAELRWDHYVDAHLKRLEAKHEAGTLALATLRHARSIAKHFLTPLLKGRDIRKIKTGHLDDFVLAIAKNPLTGRPTSLSTRAAVITRLNAVLNEALHRGDLDRLPKLPPIERPELDYSIPTEAERSKIFGCITAEHYPIFQFVRLEPVRPGEACKLARPNLNLQEGVARIVARKAGGQIEMPLHDDVIATLSALEPHGLLVFSHWWRGAWRPYTTGFMDKLWHEARLIAGLPQFNLYPSTRHFIATRAVRAGIDIGAVSKALGHTSIGMTAKTYAHYNTESIRRVINLSEEPKKRRGRPRRATPDRPQP